MLHHSVASFNTGKYYETNWSESFVLRSIIKQIFTKIFISERFLSTCEKGVR